MTGYSGTRLAKKLGALPLHADRFVRGRLAPNAARLIAMVVLAAGLLGCRESPRPDLKRLYQLGTPDAEAAAPVILIPGAFGTRLRDRVSGEEIWPGPWWRILFSSYPELALDIDPATNAPRPSPLEAAGIAEQALRRDFTNVDAIWGLCACPARDTGAQGRATLLRPFLRLASRHLVQRAGTGSFDRGRAP